MTFLHTFILADCIQLKNREVKVPLYAAHGVPEVWLVDLQHRRLEVYREPCQEPGTEGYRLMLRPAPSEKIAPVLLPTVYLRIDEIWSPN